MVYLFLLTVTVVLVILFKNKIVEYFYPFSDDNEIQFKAVHYHDNLYTLYYSCNVGRTYRTIMCAKPDGITGIFVNWGIDDYRFFYRNGEKVENFKLDWKNYTAVLEYEKEQVEKVKSMNESLRRQREDYYERRNKDLNL